jgi:hypothetical protein
MALPPLSIKITADATNAKAGLKEVSAATKAADIAAEQYQSSLRKVDAAQKSGLISQKAAATATMQAEAAYESATRAAAALTGAQITVGRAAKVAGAQIKSSAGHTANLGAQFNDIGVMLAAGQSPLMLAMQQGTQINQVMAQMGGGKTALRGLGAAFLGIINPMSLATIGIIAGGAALVQWGMKAFGASEEAKKMAEQVEALADAVEDAEERLRAARMGTSSAENTAMEELEKKTAKVLELTQRIGTARGTNLRGLRRSLGEAQAEVVVARERLELIQRANTHVGLYEDGLNDAAIAALELAGVDINENISEAAKSAATLAANLGISFQNASLLLLENEKLAAQMAQYGQGQLAARALISEQRLSVDGRAPGVDDPNAPTKKSISAANSRTGQIDALVNSLQTERETIADWYAESQAMLADASQAQLDEIGGKQAAIERLEKEHQDRLMGIRADGESSTLSQAGQFFGDMANATRGGNEEMLKISKAFGAAQALISAWQGAAEALKLPFPGNIAAFGAVLAQGMGAVSAIQSISAGGGGGGGGGSAASAAPAAAQSITRTVDVNLSGGSESSQGSIRSLIAQINDAIGDGATLNVRGMA